MKISFITSGHEPFDDRIFYHMAKTLHAGKNRVGIISSKQDFTEVAEEIEFYCFAGDNLTKRNKIRYFTDRLSAFMPDTIVCSEPLTVLAASKYRDSINRKIRIIYDITEWYPSKKNLSGISYLLRWLVFLKLVAYNLRAAWLADSFIFGEFYKSRPFRFLFPYKPFIFISYYPDLKYIPFSKPELNKGKLRLAYSGKISLEKGYGHFFKVLQKLSEQKKELLIEVKIIGWYETTHDKIDCENLFAPFSKNISLQMFEKQNLKSFLDLIKETDIFLDLRSGDNENQHCLPIKLFYYAALGRPVIQSDLKAVRKEVEIDKFGFLVNPDNSDLIVQLILNYLNDEELYYRHCRNARNMALDSYNWQSMEVNFLRFLTREWDAL